MGSNSKMIRWLGALTFIGMVLFEAVRTLQGTPWPGYTMMFHYIIGTMNIALWIVSAVVLVTSKSWGWIVGPLGALTALVHGLGIRLESDVGGFVFIAGSLIVGAGLVAGLSQLRMRRDDIVDHDHTVVVTREAA
jgi:hypothetical protein